MLILAVCITVMLYAVGASACSYRPLTGTGDAVTASLALATVEDSEKQIMAVTSAELDVFRDGAIFRHADGTEAVGYSLDAEGNIKDPSGNTVTAAANIQVFTCAAELTYSEEPAMQMLTGFITEEKEAAYAPVSFEIEITVNPEDAVNYTVTIESNDPGALYFPYDANKELLSYMEEPEINVLASVTVDAVQNPVKLAVVGCFDGTYTATVRNVKDEEIGKIEFSFEKEPVPIPVDDSDEDIDSASHEHRYVDSVIEPTLRTRGYTLHICEICGNTYRDNYTEMIVCDHQYEGRVILPTYTSGGYTLYTCKTCGASYRADETPKLVCTHTWDNGSVLVAATCEREGTRLFTCSACGNTKTESIPTTAHTMATQVIVPTEASEGYTRNYCAVCGYEAPHTDITAKLPHSHTYTSSVTQPTCTSIGYTTHTCSTCGDSYTDSEVAALGHTYSESMVAATCTIGGYTQHICGRCGQTYTDNETPALGHDWEIHTEQIQVGIESHTFCDACGLDFTANGMSGDTVGYHMEAHVLNGESGRSYSRGVPIYEEVTEYICRRCGATQ